MKHERLISPLWVESANAHIAQKIAASNRRQRRLTPWLLLLAAITITYLFHWI